MSGSEDSVIIKINTDDDKLKNSSDIAADNSNDCKSNEYESNDYESNGYESKDYESNDYDSDTDTSTIDRAVCYVLLFTVFIVIILLLDW